MFSCFIQANIATTSPSLSCIMLTLKYFVTNSVTLEMNMNSSRWVGTFNWHPLFNRNPYSFWFDRTRLLVQDPNGSREWHCFYPVIRLRAESLVCLHFCVYYPCSLILSWLCNRLPYPPKTQVDISNLRLIFTTPHST